MAKIPPMGWSTWCTETAIVPCADDWCSEPEVKSVAEAMISNGLLELGYNFIYLDDCWQLPGPCGRFPNGTIRYDESRFPSGMSGLANWLHDKDFKLLIYTDIGEKTCRLRTGSWPHYELDARTYASWGIDGVKIDYCDKPAGFTTEQLYANFSRALQGTGRDMLVNFCEWGRDSPWDWVGDFANTYRIGPDHLPLRWTANTSQDPGQGQGTWNVIEHMGWLSENSRNFSDSALQVWGDPDYLMTQDSFYYNWQSSKTEFTLWALFGAPLIVSTDVRTVADKWELFNKDAIAVNQDPLGIPGRRVQVNADGGQVWTRPLAPLGKRFAAVLYNANLADVGVGVELEFSPVVLPHWPANATSARVFDVWAGSDLGIFQKSFTTHLSDPFSVQFLLLQPKI